MSCRPLVRIKSSIVDQLPKSVPILEAQTRFLRTFNFSPNSISNLSRRLSSVRWNGRGVWLAAALVEVYTRDYLPKFPERYFATAPDLFIVDPQCAAQWGGKAFLVCYSQTPTDAGIRFAGWGESARLPGATRGARPVPPIELFLSPQGVGALSIALAPLAEPGSFTVQELKRFNNKVAQVTLEKSGFLLPVSSAKDLDFSAPVAVPELDGSAIAKIVKSGDRDFGDKVLGKVRAPYSRGPEGPQAGQWFALSELADWLLAPFDVEPEPQLRVYTAAALPSEWTVTTKARPEGTPESLDLTANASALAQIEEDDHPLPASGETGVSFEIMDTHSILAVSAQGAAQLSAVQLPLAGETVHEFNNQLINRAIRERFPAYLAALVQRTCFLEWSREAARIPPSGEARSSGVANLRERLLKFLLTGFFTEVSSRDVVNRFYQVCQRGLRVPQHRALIQDSLTALEQNETLFNMLSASQTAEWIEFFVLGIYSVEMTHIFTGLFAWQERPAGFAAAAVLLLTGICYWLFKGLPGAKPVFTWHWVKKLAFLAGALALCISSLALLGSRVWPRYGTAETRELAQQVEREQSRLHGPDLELAAQHPRIRRLSDDSWRLLETARREQEHDPASAREEFEQAAQYARNAVELARQASEIHLRQTAFFTACPDDCQAQLKGWQTTGPKLKAALADGDFDEAQSLLTTLESALQRRRRR